MRSEELRNSFHNMTVSGMSTRLGSRLRLAKSIVSGLLALTGLAMLLVTFSPVTLWYTRLLAGPWNDPKGEVLIVPAADGGPGDLLGEFSYWRTVYAAWAWQSGGFRQVVLTGSRASCEPMRRYLLFEGVPEESIQMEVRSASTRDNGVHTERILRGVSGRKVLLTSDFHMFRAQRAFAAAGLNTLPRPIPDAGKRAQRWQARWGVFLELMVETGKIIYYRLRGWI